jgi:Fur family iron response transcriptional regulator
MAPFYNTINLFGVRVFLRTVYVDPPRLYYDSSIDPHHHFYTADPGALTDSPLAGVTLLVGAERPAGTEPAGVDVVVRIRAAKA